MNCLGVKLPELPPLNGSTLYVRNERKEDADAEEEVSCPL
jgi:hypothetical protein